MKSKKSILSGQNILILLLSILFMFLVPRALQSQKIFVVIILIAFVIPLFLTRLSTGSIFALFCLFTGFGLLQNLSIPGLFRINDLGLVLGLFLSLAIYKKNVIPRTYRGYFTKIYIIGLIYIIFEIIQTIIIQKQPFMQTILVARDWIYFLVYFTLVPFMFYYKKWPSLLKWVAYFTVAGAMLYIIQYMIRIPILNPFYAIAEDTIDGTQIERLAGGLIYGPDLLVGSGLLYLAIKSGGKNRKALIGLLFIILKVLLSFGRGYSIAFFVTLIITAIFSDVDRSRKIKLAIMVSISSILMVSIFSYFFYGQTDLFSNLFIERMTIGSSDFQSRSGEYSSRASYILNAYELIKNYPILGIGFVHNDISVSRWGVWASNAHTGYGTLWCRLGFGGFVLYVVYTIVVFFRARRVIGLTLPIEFKIIAVSTLSFVIAGYFNMFSTSSFVSPISFTYLGILTAVLDNANHHKSQYKLTKV